jgi:cold shock CspA family protein
MRYHGQIVSWVPSKQFGFIRRTDTNSEHFFHISEIKEGVVVVGSFVDFELIPANRLGKPHQAANIRITPSLADLMNSEAAQ